LTSKSLEQLARLSTMEQTMKPLYEDLKEQLHET
jgi:hypothetical protein